MKNVNKLISVKKEVMKAVIGKDNIIELVMAAIIAGGHILLEDIPCLFLRLWNYM